MKVNYKERIVIDPEIHFGSLLLRMTPSTNDEVHKELKYFLTEHREEDFNQSFSVIEPKRYRIRKIIN